MSEINFAFDLDGTITKEELLPLMAREIDLHEELELLTQLTLNGSINFEQSFKLRVALLKNISIERINRIVEKVEFDKDIETFIMNNKDRCTVVTGNLDVWIQPLIDRLGCKFYTSTAKFQGDQLLGIEKTLNKSSAIIELKKKHKRVVTIGESFNDISMFTESDLGIAFGGVHDPVSDIIKISDFVVYRGDKLCQLLNTLL